MDSELANKIKPQYFGLMVVVRRIQNSVYCLAELDRVVSKLCYAAFHLIPYFAHSWSAIPVMHILDQGDLTTVIKEEVLHSNGALEGDDEA
jgi:hypothetical protein